MFAACAINPRLKAGWQVQPSAAARYSELQMNILRDVSIRATLAAVFLVLAAGLCGTLAWEFYAMTPIPSPEGEGMNYALIFCTSASDTSKLA
jgi:hypothetical protein